MTESLQNTAQLTAVQEADLTDLATLRNRAKDEFRAREGCSLTYLAFFARALVGAARDYPQFNASIDIADNEIVYHPEVDLGLAVDTPRGLVVPVIRSAQDKSTPELARAIADVAERVRSGKAGPDELSGSTITLSNIGSSGSLTDTPILNYPEVAILGTGAIVRRPRVIDGPDGDESMVVRSVCSLPLTYDHRLLDGADAGRFLSAVRERLKADAFAEELRQYIVD